MCAAAQCSATRALAAAARLFRLVLQAEIENTQHLPVPATSPDRLAHRNLDRVLATRALLAPLVLTLPGHPHLVYLQKWMIRRTPCYADTGCLAKEHFRQPKINALLP